MLGADDGRLVVEPHPEAVPDSLHNVPPEALVGVAGQGPVPLAPAQGVLMRSSRSGSLTACMGRHASIRNRSSMYG